MKLADAITIYAEQQKWIGFDFDATLAKYTSYEEGQVGPPIKGAETIALVKKYLAEGTQVKIFTARANNPADVKAIQNFCKKTFGTVLPVTNVKDQFMEKLYDDRAVAVEPNTGKVL